MQYGTMQDLSSYLHKCMFVYEFDLYITKNQVHYNLCIPFLQTRCLEVQLSLYLL